MGSPQIDLSIFKKFNFQKPPVGIKYLYNKPEGIEKLGKNMAFCEMFGEAQQRNSPFYITPENQSCRPGAYVWGGESLKVFESGAFGVAMKLFKEARADIRVHKQSSRLDKDLIKYVIFSQLNQISFDPDLFIIITDTARQSEIILRAMSYTSGEVWSSKMTPVMGCSWLMAYPYVTGEVNYVTTGFGSGMIAKKLFPEGHQIISIPYNWLPVITRNLQEMPWVPEAWATEDLGAFIKRIHTELGLTPQS
jgi:uncharacterized protein (DUF169 family)